MLQLRHFLVQALMPPPSPTKKTSDGDDGRRAPAEADMPMVVLLVSVQRLVMMLALRQGGDLERGLLREFIQWQFAKQPEECAMLLQALEMNAIIVLIDGAAPTRARLESAPTRVAAYRRRPISCVVPPRRSRGSLASDGTGAARRGAGIDEAAEYKKQVEEFLVLELEQSGVRVVATTRPEGVRLGPLYSNWVLLDLQPLSEHQQQGMILTQLKTPEQQEQFMRLSRFMQVSPSSIQAQRAVSPLPELEG